MRLLFLKSLLLLALAFLPCSAYSANNILVFGDSLSAGYGIPIDKGWVALLQNELKRTQSRFDVVNSSISGETTAGGKRRIAGALKQHRPAIVIVELGANDGLRGYELTSTEANLDEIITQAIRADSKVLLVGMEMPPNYGKAYTGKFRELYVQLANKHRILLVPFLLKGVPADQFQRDNLHPNEDAQQRIMLNVLQELKHLLH